MNQFTLLQSKSYNDLYYACTFVLNDCKIKYTKSNLKNLLETHVEYPSLLSLKDILAEYNVSGMAVRKGSHSYEEFETPFICSIQKEGWPTSSFTVVTYADETGLTYMDPNSQKPVYSSIENFEKMDKAIILLLDGEMAKDEANYKENRRLEITDNIIQFLPIFLLISVFAGSIFNIFIHGYSLIAFVGGIFLFTSLVGALVTCLLIRHDINSHDPLVREVCGSFGKKSNCTSVLSSKQSSFLEVSWTVWGGSLFISLFISNIFFLGQASNLLLWASLSILVSPYLIFSIYYQWRIVKQWCPLCLLIQGLIAINLFISVIFFQYYSFDVGKINYHHLFINLFLGIATMLLIYFAIPVLKRANDSKEYMMKWMKFRYNPSIFNSLLEKSNQITVPVNNIGVLIGDDNATIEIIKVCNPYCGPCAKAHPELENIIKNNKNVSVRIIFTASGEERDIRTAPVQHLLAIQEKFGKLKVHEALDNWYMSPNKDYSIFATKYPLKGELEQQRVKVFAMRDWCDEMKIRATPTLFINGRELPDQYNIKDLKHFF